MELSNAQTELSIVERNNIEEKLKETEERLAKFAKREKELEV
jgi:hypothetical protein